MADTLGQDNPFRYRGYYYDTESGLYYLQSRYYDPVTYRFLNADGLVSTGQGLNGTNMFAYCGNNPVMNSDPSGHFWKEIGNFFKKVAQTVVDIVVAPFKAVAVAKEIHYKRNDLNTDIPQNEKDVPMDWKTSNIDDKTRRKGPEASAHQFSVPKGKKNNTKYVSPDGHKEVIFNYNKDIVLDSRDVGTYNFFASENGIGEFILHGVYDVVPWIIWGNTADDTTMWWDRAGSMVTIGG